MAKLFYIHEVDELMNDKIKEMALNAALADPIVVGDIECLRHYKEFATLVVDAMREMEADEDRRVAEYRRQLSEKKEEASDGADS